MNSLMIGDNERLALQGLAVLAARCPLDLEHMVEDVQTAEGLARYASYMQAHTVLLPVGFTACFSVELNHPAGPMRHLGLSAAKGELLPSLSVVWSVAVELGFAGCAARCAVWLADAQQDEPSSVHLAQPVSEGIPIEGLWMAGSPTVH